MKENIDLTESMIFSRGNWQFDILGSMINKLMLNEYRFPWNIKTIKLEDDLDECLNNFFKFTNEELLNYLTKEEDFILTNDNKLIKLL